MEIWTKSHKSIMQIQGSRNITGQVYFLLEICYGWYTECPEHICLEMNGPLECVLRPHYLYMLSLSYV